jgi:hypothetical protein
VTVPVYASDFADARPRWLAGLCPCCGGDICEWEWRDDIWEPKAIGEGVMICGRCVGNDHMAPDGFVELLLASLLP